MIVFSTRTTRHIAKKLAMPLGACTITEFSDGELFVRIDQDVQDQDVWVLAGTQTPAENMFELFFLLDALQRSGARINLFVTYFSYARQIIADQGEALNAQVICNILKQFTVIKICVIHPHSLLLHNFLSFTSVYDRDFFCELAESYDAIAAPDQGAVLLAQDIAQKTGKSLIVLKKNRPEHDKVEISSLEGNVNRLKILIVDDMISTGNTLVQAAKSLLKEGAISVAAAATHGVFSPGARDFLESSPLEKIFITNTIDQLSLGKIMVSDITPRIKKIMLQ